MSVDTLYDMSDEDLEDAFKAAKAEMSEGLDSFTTDEVVEEDLDTSVDDGGQDDEDIIDDQEEELEEEGDDQGEEETSAEDDSEEDTPADKAPSEEEEDGAPTAVAPTRHTFKANGREYEFTEDEMRQQFPRIFGQAMDYTKKLQTIQPWRRTIDAIESAKLNHQDISLMIDVFKGDKNAIAEVLKRTGVDTLDIDTEESVYKAKEYGRSEGELAIVDVLDGIKDDPEYNVTHRVLTRDWDEASWAVLSRDPVKIQQLHTDVRSGTYDRLQPIAEKLRVYDGARRSNLDYYMMAAREYYSNQEQERLQEQARQLAEREKQLSSQTQVANAKQQQQKREAGKQDASRRKAASPSGRASARTTVTDYLGASDEDFDEWYKRLSERE